jgi:hypothetical protein
VAGGGAGGLRSTVTATGGGGSLESALALASGTGYTVTIGAGGNGGTGGGNQQMPLDQIQYFQLSPLLVVVRGGSGNDSHLKAQQMVVLVVVQVLTEA